MSFDLTCQERTRESVFVVLAELDLCGQFVFAGNVTDVDLVAARRALAVELGV